MWEALPEELHDAVYDFAAHGDENYLLNQIASWVQEHLMCLADGCELVASVGSDYCWYHTDIHMI